MQDMKTYKLRNGLELPWIAFGTGVVWKYTRNKTLFLKTNLIEVLRSAKRLKLDRELKGNLYISSILQNAYNAGFRMFDSGRIYAHSEDRIGKNISNKENVFLVTKCSAMDITRTYSPNDVAGNLDISLKNLRRDSVDLYLLHWPEGDWLNYYNQIINEYKNGRCRAFGACNMDVSNLESIENAGLELPMVVQTEMHPLCIRKPLREFCKAKGIQLMAHTPTARGAKDLLESDVMKELQKKYAKSCVQIIIRWHFQNNVIPVVSAFSKDHMKEDLDVFDFELAKEEMIAIDSLDCNRILLDSHGIDDPNYIYNY